MKLRDIIIILLCCVMWGANIPISRWALLDAPPILLAAMRFSLIIIFLFPFILPVPKQWGRVFLVSICIGGLNFLFLYIGIASTPSGIVAIVGQMGLPLTIFFSVWFLGEKLDKYQMFGTFFAFVGILIVIIKPQNFHLQTGVILVVISTILASFGSIIMKIMRPIRGVRLQVWVGIFSVIPLFLASFIFEKPNIAMIKNFGPNVWISLFFSVLAVSILGHTTYYSMVKKYDVSLVIPYTVTVPIWAIVISHQLLNEKITMQFVIGSVICIIGIFILSFKNSFIENKSDIG